MFVEFIGLPGSGKSTLIKTLKRLSAHSDLPAVSLNHVAEEVLAARKENPGYLRRKADRGWFYGTFSFAHKYPEIFRIAFENTLINTPGQLDFLDLLGQYHFARLSQEERRLVLVDEGLLHRGAAAFLNPEAFSSLENYLDNIPAPDAVVFIDIDIETAIERSKQRKKGIPVHYRKFTEAELFQHYEHLQALHQQCLTRQSQVIHIDSAQPLTQNAEWLLERLVKAAQSARKEDSVNQ